MPVRYITVGKPLNLTKKKIDQLIKYEKKSIKGYMSAGLYDEAEEEKKHLMELLKLRRLL